MSTSYVLVYFISCLNMNMIQRFLVRVAISHNINKLKDYLCPLSLVAWIFVGSIITFQKKAFLFQQCNVVCFNTSATLCFISVSNFDTCIY